MSLSTYLHFAGNCAEAFEFYRNVFGGDYSMRMTFGEGPQEFGFSQSDGDRIMHIALPIGASVLMGSDVPSNQLDDQVSGNNFSISYTGESRDRCDEVLAGLSEGGKVVMPMAEMFWGDYFGMCEDKFAIRWMVSTNAAAS